MGSIALAQADVKSATALEIRIRFVRDALDCCVLLVRGIVDSRAGALVESCEEGCAIRLSAFTLNSKGRGEESI